MISYEGREVLDVVGEELLYARVGHVHDKIGRVASYTYVVEIALLINDICTHLI